jgi:hypothetical protein
MAPALNGGAGSVLEPAEEVVVAAIRARLAARGDAAAGQGAAHVEWAVQRLVKIWEAVVAHPSTAGEQTLGARHRDVGSLIDTLSACSPWAAEVFVPTRGTLVRAFLQAKLNFCRLLAVVVDETLAADPARPGLDAAIDRVQISAVCTIIAEDLLRLVTGDAAEGQDVRRRAAWVLAQMWEDRVCRIVPQLVPVLDSVWQAKSRVAISYGTLSGAGELLALLAAGCDPVFVEAFSGDAVPDDAEYALQELVFNFTHEQLRRLQDHMATTGRTALDRADVASVLDIPAERLRVRTCTCEEMIFTFRERQVMAGHRLALGLPGPKRTAEQCLLVYLLERATDADLSECLPAH